MMAAGANCSLREVFSYCVPLAVTQAAYSMGFRFSPLYGKSRIFTEFLF